MLIQIETKFNLYRNVTMIFLTRLSFFENTVVKYINIRLNYSFGPSICHEISVWSSSFSLSQFGPHFLKNDSIWSSPFTLTRRC